MTRIGTAHFVDLAAAGRYYRPYGYTAADVNRKLAEGEIYLGPPPFDPAKGEALHLTDEGTRYAVEYPDALPVAALPGITPPPPDRHWHRHNQRPRPATDTSEV